MTEVDWLGRIRRVLNMHSDCKIRVSAESVHYSCDIEIQAHPDSLADADREHVARALHAYLFGGEA